MYQKMKPLYKAKAFITVLLRRYNLAKPPRSQALIDEVKFWDNWLSTHGSIWPDDYTRRINPDRYLSDYHRTFIDHLPEKEITILDVGSGPLTALGKKHPSKSLHIIATDYLAKEYDLLLKRHHIEPVVRTTFADSEKLTDYFAHNMFDFVNAQNSVDHTENPLEVIKQMLNVAKPDCFVVLHHAENEAEHERYDQLHQWNFTVQNGRFIIKKGGRKGIDVEKELGWLGTFDSRTVNNYCHSSNTKEICVTGYKRVTGARSPTPHTSPPARAPDLRCCPPR